MYLQNLEIVIDFKNTYYSWDEVNNTNATTLIPHLCSTLDNTFRSQSQSSAMQLSFPTTYRWMIMSMMLTPGTEFVTIDKNLY